MQPKAPVGFTVNEFIRDIQPKFNPVIAKGIVVEHMKEVEAYIDKVWKITSASYPPNLVYKGYRRCTPEEEMREILAQRSKRTIELSKSNVYLVNFYFEMDGQEIVKPVFLPYVNQAGQIYLRDTLRTVLPVLSDGGLSVSKGTIFVGLLGTKITFNRLPYSFMVNDNVVNNYVVYGKIYNADPTKTPHYQTRKDPSIKMEHATSLYLLSKYGFWGTMERYFPEVKLEVFTTSSIDKRKYPEDKYLIIKSVGVQPKGVKLSDYMPNTIHFVIPREQYSAKFETFMMGFFYVVDHYSHRVHSTEWLESIDLWRSILGHAIFRTTDGMGKLIAEADKHIISIDNYLDDFFKKGLEEEGVYVDNIYDLMLYLIEHFTSIILATDVGTMYGKKPVVLRYVLDNIVKGINKFKFSVQYTNKRQFTIQDINRELGKALQPDAVFGMTSDHPEVTTIMTAGDCYVFGYTSNSLRQEKAMVAKSSKNRLNLNDPINHFHASILEIGSVLNLPKSDPTGWAHLNVFQTRFRVNGGFLPDPKWKPIIERVRSLTRRT